jgi:nucleoside-diphosphate-sugar epimerase
MHVLVTGATGFTGFHTVLALAKHGHKVRLFARSLEKMQKLYAGFDVDTSDYVLGEMTDPEAIERALDGCDAVVHTAAVVGLEPELEEMMMRTNMIGTELVIGGAVKKGIRSIVYVSSLAALFDPDGDTMNEESPYAKPTTAYATSKKQCDEYVRQLIADGANIAVTYPAAIIGPDDPALSESSQGLTFLYRFGFMNMPSGFQIIDVRELADVHMRLLEASSSGLYVVAGHYVPWKTYGKILDSITGKKLIKYPAPGWLMMMLGSITDFLRHFFTIDMPLSRDAAIFATKWIPADDRKLRKELNISYRPVEETLRDTMIWMIKNGHIDKKWGVNLIKE